MRWKSEINVDFLYTKPDKLSNVRGALERAFFLSGQGNLPDIFEITNFSEFDTSSSFQSPDAKGLV
jgi:hypothetical protein